MMPKDWEETMVKWMPMQVGFDLAPEKLALIVIDMQTYFCDPNYGVAKFINGMPHLAEYYFPNINNVVIPNIVKLVDHFRNNNMDIIFVKSGYLRKDKKDFLSLRKGVSDELEKKFGKGSLPVIGDFEYDFTEEIKIFEDDVVFHKITRGAFTSTGIDQYLRNVGLDTLIVTGVLTNVCVLTTAIQASDKNYKTVIVDDASGSVDKQSHDTTLHTFSRSFGRVLSTEEIIKLTGQN